LYNGGELSTSRIGCELPPSRHAVERLDTCSSLTVTKLGERRRGKRNLGQRP